MPGQKFLVWWEDLPSGMYEFLKTQPKHTDVTRESHYAVSAFADVEGVVLYEPDGTARFKALKVFSVEPAKKSYVESWGRWPPPATFEKRAN